MELKKLWYKISEPYYMRLVNLLKDCEHATYLISKGQVNPLSGWEKLWLNLHLFTCQFCKRLKKQTDIIQKFLSEYMLSGKAQAGDSRKKAEIEKFLDEFSDPAL
jgi:hypothetical protein